MVVCANGLFWVWKSVVFLTQTFDCKLHTIIEYMAMCTLVFHMQICFIVLRRHTSLWSTRYICTCRYIYLYFLIRYILVPSLIILKVRGPANPLSNSKYSFQISSEEKYVKTDSIGTMKCDD